MSVIGQVHSLTLQTWPSVGDVHCMPAVPSASLRLSSRGFCWETSWVFLLWLALWVIREAWMSASPVGCQALPCEAASGPCLARPGHKVNGCRTPGLVLFYWWLDSGPRRPWGYCPPTGRWSQILWLRPEYWQEDLVARVWLQTPGTPELLSDCWRGKC